MLRQLLWFTSGFLIFLFDFFLFSYLDSLCFEYFNDLTFYFDCFFILYRLFLLLFCRSERWTDITHLTFGVCVRFFILNSSSFSFSCSNFHESFIMILEFYDSTVLCVIPQLFRFIDFKFTIEMRYYYSFFCC